ncbi:hypothetical protein [Streptomyces sp. OE57]|uniref:hypothetical protein n=1 Tax=Streptomyces lacaronensis TaxID=3379885 RepID=UPI0039B761D1
MSAASNIWGAAPQTALWYGEITFGRDITDDDGALIGTETDYTYGYSNDPLPDPAAMCPQGFEVLEERLTQLHEQVAFSRNSAVQDSGECEFRVWRENGDLIASPGTYEEAADALREAVQADIDRYGTQNAACGVLSTYGYSIDVVEGDRCVTQDFMINHPDCPLDDAAIVEAGE